MDFFLGEHCIYAKEIINELPGREAEIFREPEGILTFLCETEASILGFTSRILEEKARQGKQVGPATGARWWTLKSTLKRFK